MTTFADPGAALVAVVAAVVRDELDKRDTASGFLDVAGAAAFLSTTPKAVRMSVTRHGLPAHKAPNGRLLFDRQELSEWVKGA